MRDALASLGSSTRIGWKRRFRAASASKYFLYSAWVVAAMVRNSPRARAGLSKFGGVVLPGRPSRADHRVCFVDEEDDGRGDFLTSSITDFNRFSNSPFNPSSA